MYLWHILTLMKVEKKMINKQKAKEITESEISTLKYMLSTFPENNKVTLVTLQAKKYKLNDEFINEFREYLTKEAFSTSPELEYTMINKYSDLFDYNIWSEKTEKSLEPLLNDDFVKKYVGTDGVEGIILSTDVTYMTEDIFKKYFSILGNDLKKLVINSSHLTSEELLRQYPDLVTERIFLNKKVVIDWSNSLIEYILDNKQLTVRFLINILSKTKDFGFISLMLNKDFNYIESERLLMKN